MATTTPTPTASGLRTLRAVAAMGGEVNNLAGQAGINSHTFAKLVRDGFLATVDPCPACADPDADHFDPAHPCQRPLPVKRGNKCYGRMRMTDAGWAATGQTPPPAEQRQDPPTTQSPGPDTFVEAQVAAETAPLGVLLWPTVDDELYAPNYTLREVARVLTAGGTEYVRWTYQSGRTYDHELGAMVVVRVPRREDLTGCNFVLSYAG